MATFNGVTVDMPMFNIGDALAQGDATARQIADNRQVRDMRNFLAQSGDAVMRGDQNALGQYARIVGPEAPLNILDTRQTMDIRGNQDRRAETRLGMDVEELRMKREEIAAAAAQAAAQQSVEETRADLTVLTNAVGYLRQGDDPANVRAALDALVQADPEAAQPFLGPRGEVDVEGLALTLEGSRRGLLMALGEPDPMLEQGEAERDIRNVDGVLYEIPAEGEPIPLTAARDRAPLVSIGGQETALPEPPAGYAWRLDPQTRQPIIDPQTGTGVLVPVAGGPKDTSAKDAEKDRGQQIRLGGTLELLNLNVAEVEDGGLAVTGPWGDFRRTRLGRVFGSDAVDFGVRSDAITNQAALAEVQRMRDNSPTGGAVGSLTDSERIAIGEAVTVLNASTSAEEYVRAAKSYQRTILDIAYGEGNWSMSEDGASVELREASPSEAAPPPYLSEVDRRLWEFYDESERQAVIDEYEARR